MKCFNFLKIFAVGIAYFFSNGLHADTIMGQKSDAEIFVRANPKWQNSVIKNTSLSDWGRCGYLYVTLIGEEATGSQLPKDIALMVAVQGIALKTARSNFLSKGYTAQNLDDLFKTFTVRKLTKDDADYCANVWMAKILADMK
jgi:hypothetical protein